jgi:hypothetical protein
LEKANKVGDIHIPPTSPDVTDPWLARQIWTNRPRKDTGGTLPHPWERNQKIRFQNFVDIPM